MKVKVKPFLVMRNIMDNKAEVEMEMENASLRGVLRNRK